MMRNNDVLRRLKEQSFWKHWMWRGFWSPKKRCAQSNGQRAPDCLAWRSIQYWVFCRFDFWGEGWILLGSLNAKQGNDLGSQSKSLVLTRTTSTQRGVAEWKCVHLNQLFLYLFFQIICQLKSTPNLGTRRQLGQASAHRPSRFSRSFLQSTPSCQVSQTVHKSPHLNN